MALEYVRKDDYCPIYGWMLELEMEMHQIIIYAMIYGFTRTKGMFFYRREWLAEWVDCRPDEVDMVVGWLIYQDLITRQKVKTEYGESYVLVARLREEDL